MPSPLDIRSRTGQGPCPAASRSRGDRPQDASPPRSRLIADGVAQPFRGAGGRRSSSERRRRASISPAWSSRTRRPPTGSRSSPMRSRTRCAARGLARRGGVVAVRPGVLRRRARARRLAEGCVSGAVHTTADTLRPALKVIRPAEGVASVSSFFLMGLASKTPRGTTSSPSPIAAWSPTRARYSSRTSPAAPLSASRR
jgi:hypothetical protein